MAQAPIEIVLSNGQKAGSTLKELQQSANRLKKEINDLKPGSEEFVKKSKDFQQVTGRLKEVRGEVSGVNTASKSLLGTFSQFLPFSGTLGTITSNFRLLNTTLGGTTKGLQAVKIALASTGIGLLIIAIGSLISYLTTTQEGMDAVTKVTRPLQAIFQRLIGVVQQLGGKVFKELAEAIKNPKQALSDLWEFIKDKFLAQIESLGLYAGALSKIFKGEFKEGFTDLGNAVIQTTTGVRNGIDKINGALEATTNFIGDSIKAGQRLDELQKQIERTELRNEQTRDRMKTQIKEQNDIVEDELASLEDRRAASEKAMALQAKIMAQDKELIDLRVEKMELEHTLNDTSIEDEKELAKIKNEGFAKEQEIIEMRTTMRNKLNIIEKRISDEEKKRIEERNKMESEAAQNIQNLRLQVMQEGFEKELAQINSDTERKIEALKGSEAQITEQRLLIEQERQQQIDELTREKEKKDLDTKLERMDLEFELEEQKITELRELKLISENEYEESLEAARLERLNNRLQMTIDFYGKESAEAIKAAKETASAESEIAKKRIENAKKHEEAKQDIQERGHEAFETGISSTIDLLSKDEDARRKNADKIKAFEAARIGVGVQAEIQAIWEYANKNPSNAFFPGAANIIAIVKTAAAVARATNALAKVNSQKFSLGGLIRTTKYAMGGILKGRLHSQGGIPGIVKSSGQPIEMEDGEIILNKRVGMDPEGLRMASDLNARYGGIRFLEAGGPVNPLSPTEGISSQTGSASRNAENGSAMINKLDMIYEAIKAYPDRLKVINMVSDTQEGIKVINKLQADADF